MLVVDDVHPQASVGVGREEKVLFVEVRVAELEVFLQLDLGGRLRVSMSHEKHLVTLGVSQARRPRKQRSLVGIRQMDSLGSDDPPILVCLHSR